MCRRVRFRLPESPVELNRVVRVDFIGPATLRWTFSRDVRPLEGHGETYLQAWSLLEEWESPEGIGLGPTTRQIDTTYLVGSQAGWPWRINADPAHGLGGGPFAWPAEGLIEAL